MKTPRDLSSPLTVINRFTTMGDPENFEKEFTKHSQYLRHQRDFDFLVTLQLIERPEVYVHFSHWRSLHGFLDVVHDDAYLRHVQRLGRLVETEADQGVSLGRTAVRNAAPGTHSVVLLSMTAGPESLELEHCFTALSGRAAQCEHFGGADLMRSTVRPMVYYGLVWWTDGESCDKALHSEAFQNALHDLSRVARTVLERVRHVAYERVIEE
jgi:heme-degrading monooxygenase HmoA